MNRCLGFACGLLVAWGALPACGGESTDGARFSSGTPEKALSSVTDAEMESLCSAVTDYFSEAEFLTGSCRFGGIFVAALSQIGEAKPVEELRAMCADIESECVEAIDSGTALIPRACKKPTGPCTATFADVEACASDSRKSQMDFHATLPACGALKQSDFERDGIDPGDPAKTRGAERPID